MMLMASISPHLTTLYIGRLWLFCGYVGGWVMSGGAGGGGRGGGQGGLGGCNSYHMSPCHFSHLRAVVTRFPPLLLPSWSDYLREKWCFSLRLYPPCSLKIESVCRWRPAPYRGVNRDSSRHGDFMDSCACGRPVASGLNAGPLTERDLFKVSRGAFIELYMFSEGHFRIVFFDLCLWALDTLIFAMLAILQKPLKIIENFLKK